MSIKRTIGIIASISLAMMLAFSTGCGVGGTNIKLEGWSLGEITRDGKTLQGLPSEEINLLLQASAREITIKYSADGAILTLSPSGATIEIKASGISINGMKPEQIKVEWVVSKQD